jgi:hypothetical protein
VLKAGLKDPIADMKGVAVYTEVGKRHVTVPMANAELERKTPVELLVMAEAMGVAGASKMSKQDLVSSILKVRASGPVTVEYIETYDDGTHLLAQTQAVLR